jgi:hypothetical protein
VRKLRIWATLRTAYQFLAIEFWTLVRLSWFPLLVSAVVQYVAKRQSIDATLAAGGFRSDGVKLVPTWWDPATFVVDTVVYSMVAVAIHRIILFGERRPGTYLLIAFGRAELLFMIIPAIIFFVVFAGTFGGVGIAWLFGLLSAAASSSDLKFLLLAPWLVLIVWATMRSVLIYPIIVAENRFHLRESWQLSKGNFWRLFWAFLFGFLPPIVVLLVLYGLSARLLFPLAAGQVPPGSSIEEIAQALKGALLYESILTYLWSLVSVALGVALLCFSYKALKGIGSNELIPRPQLS